eukprot:CAMPEP_0181189004 /NCGR_PEP_ID=MMETSP1096-20121128/11429_1 /TAXON_ID=156174 ORGANISM="Chrysochromulina ericina, Strain CCMP281" /NCGR_SAMPLE_ID=MMETSP1096 /ASSEMBLY_ACC=CAM_ASM_000453 /LENGTH=69 /DNA_ID=CAMNT_0023278125 /DNA_START=292 /DNA_END=501 /DNA_ORIENTATION=+
MYEVNLHPWQLKVRTIRVLLLIRLIQSPHEDHRIGLLCGRMSGRKAAGVPSMTVAPTRGYDGGGGGDVM